MEIPSTTLPMKVSASHQVITGSGLDKIDLRYFLFIGSLCHQQSLSNHKSILHTSDKFYKKFRGLCIYAIEVLFKHYYLVKCKMSYKTFPTISHFAFTKHSPNTYCLSFECLTRVPINLSRMAHQ